jgi:hypothetical protein
MDRPMIDTGISYFAVLRPRSYPRLLHNVVNVPRFPEMWDTTAPALKPAADLQCCEVRKDWENLKVMTQNENVAKTQIGKYQKYQN